MLHYMLFSVLVQSAKKYAVCHHSNFCVLLMSRFSSAV